MLLKGFVSELLSKIKIKIMASINAVIVPAKALSGGKHKIRISVAHNSKTRYIVTDIVIDSAKEFKNGQVVRRPDASYLNTKLRNKLQKIQRGIDEIDGLESLTCSELVTLLTDKKSEGVTLEAVMEEYLGSLTKQRSIVCRRTGFNTMFKIISGSTLVKSVSSLSIQRLDASLRKSLKPSSRKTYLNYFHTLLNFAIKNGYVKYETHPMLAVTKPEAMPRESWLSVEEIRKIRDVELKRPAHRRCRDLFMLSYYLGGINIVDLLKIKFDSKRIKYVRTKTADSFKVNKYVEFEIPDEAWEIINRLKDDQGMISCTSGERRLTMRRLFQYAFPKIKEAAGISGDLVYYSARKSFAQHAFDLGIPESVIDYILGHKLGGRSSTSLYSYVWVKPEIATDAIRKVLDNLK